jgi:hypothetical protein
MLHRQAKLEKQHYRKEVVTGANIDPRKSLLRTTPAKLHFAKTGVVKDYGLKGVNGSAASGRRLFQ